MTVGAHAADVFDALTEEFRLVRQHEQIDHHAGGIHLQRPDDGFCMVLEHGPHHPMPLRIVRVAHVDPHHQSRLFTFRPALQQVCLAIGHLDCIRLGIHQGVDHTCHVLQADQEAGLVADSVIDSDIEAAAIVEEPVHPGLGTQAHHDLPCPLLAASIAGLTP